MKRKTKLISPFTGGPVELRSDKTKITWRHEEFTVPRKYYHCVDTGHDYTDAELDDDNLWEVFKAYCKKHDVNFFKLIPEDGVKQDEKWISVDDALPEFDREVFVLTDNIHGKTIDGARFLCFGHRPNPEGWDGKNIDTGKVKHYDVVTYNGWNIPGVKYWYPCPPVPGESEERYK